MSINDVKILNIKPSEIVADAVKNNENNNKKSETLNNTQLLCVKALDYMMF